MKSCCRNQSQKFLAKRTFEAACSGVVLYLGLKKRYEHILHHNFVFSRDPHVEFQQIYQQGEPADDPTCYLCAPSLSGDRVAPAGGEALYVLVHTPYLRSHHDWSRMLPKYRDVIIQKLKRVAGMEDIEERIEVEHARRRRVSTSDTTCSTARFTDSPATVGFWVRSSLPIGWLSCLGCIWLVVRHIRDRGCRW